MSSSLHSLRSQVQDARRILVRGVNWLGDAVMTTPALMRLREKFATAHIVILTPAKLEGLWLHHLAVDAVQSFAEGESAWSVGRRLRRGEYDLALVLPNSPRSALEVFLAGIPCRVGYARPWRKWFLTHQIAARPDETRMRKLSLAQIKRLNSSATPSQIHYHKGAHHIFQYLHLASMVGASPDPMAPEIMLIEPEIKQAEELLARESPVPDFWLGLNPGAEYGPAKRWPLERFAETAVEVHRKTQCGWVVLGGAKDAPTASSLAGQLKTKGVNPVLNLAGKTSLRQLCALLKICRVLLTNDSGPMHLAAAVETPVIAPFGSTSPELTGPGLPLSLGHRLLKADVACSPCFRRVCPIDFRCMNGISVEHVVHSILDFCGSV